MLVVIRGAGDLASGIALRLHHAGFDIVMTETAAPLSVRRTVCFSQAVYEGSARVEDVDAILVSGEAGITEAFAKKQIAVLVDPGAAIATRIRPDALIDAVMAKKNTGTNIMDAPVIIGVGPGFTAGIDCHGVIETQRGHTLGRVITEGSALPNTGIPGDIGGYTVERLLRCPADGLFEALASIGEMVKRGDTVAVIRTAKGPDGGKGTALFQATGADAAVELPLRAEIDGMLRGILPSGIYVKQGMKAGDVDPRCEKSHCFTVSDKALAVGGGVLEALFRFTQNR